MPSPPSSSRPAPCFGQQFPQGQQRPGLGLHGLPVLAVVWIHGLLRFGQARYSRLNPSAAWTDSGRREALQIGQRRPGRFHGQHERQDCSADRRQHGPPSPYSPSPPEQPAHVRIQVGLRELPNDVRPAEIVLVQIPGDGLGGVMVAMQPDLATVEQAARASSCAGSTSRWLMHSTR